MAGPADSDLEKSALEEGGSRGTTGDWQSFNPYPPATSSDAPFPTGTPPSTTGSPTDPPPDPPSDTAPTAQGVVPHVDPYPKKPDQQIAGGSGDAYTDALKHIEGSFDAEAKSRREMNEQIVPYFKAIQQSLAQPLPQMPQMPQYAQAPDFQENRRALGKAQLGYLAIALPIAIALGSRGGWAAAGALGGLGRGLSEVSAGYDKQAEDSFARWRGINDQLSRRYGEQLEAYKNVLAQRQFSTGEMTNMIGMISKIYTDKQMAEVADQQKFIGVLSIMRQREENLYKMQIQTMRIEAAISKLTPKGTEAWQNYKHMFGIPEDRNEFTPDELKEMKKYPFGKFLNEYYQAKKGAAQVPGAAPTGFQTDETNDEEKAGAVQTALEILGKAQTSEPSD